MEVWQSPKYVFEQNLVHANEAMCEYKPYLIIHSKSRQYIESISRRNLYKHLTFDPCLGGGWRG